MTVKLFFVFCLITISATLAAGQGRTITNLDLEKYKNQRVAAERDLRENYAKLGFASPEERERRRIQDAKDLEDLSTRLTYERLVRERADAQRAYTESLQYSDASSVEKYSDDGVYLGGGYYYSGGRNYGYRRGNRAPQQRGYFAGGQFWPTAPRPAPQPFLATPRQPRSTGPRH